ncbi:MAG: PEP-CTERM sorting domain-containing protein [Akkermansiaceae bacterium]|jgi:hypothetical protein|nr:PEP-CTERM sorting domain-containing protein [Akkermansiaceae bacterium]
MKTNYYLSATKAILGGSSALMLTCASASAITLATANFDADSYIQFGTNNEFDPLLTIGESQRPSSAHFNWGVTTFDTSSMVTSGPKFLSLSAVEYKTLIPNSGGGPPTTVTSVTGNATLNIVALGDSYSNYQASADKLAWYDEHVQNEAVAVLGTINFTNASTQHINVTSVVNDWIDNPSNNNGFAVFSTSGNVELASVTNTNAALRPALVDAVPETSSSALLGIGVLVLIMRRHKQR